MNIKFSNRVSAWTCCQDNQIGQDHIVTCTYTGAEMIWSPTEPETLKSAMAEHHAAHDKAGSDRTRARQLAEATASARYIYRTTEPGNSARRGIGAYL